MWWDGAVTSPYAPRNPRNPGSPSRGRSQQVQPGATSSHSAMTTGTTTVGRTSGTAAEPRANGIVMALSVLVLLASIGFVVWHVQTWAASVVDSVNACSDAGGGLECLTGPDVQHLVLIPLAAAVGAFSIGIGTGVEAVQGRERGYLLGLAGLVLLAGSVWFSSR